MAEENILPLPFLIQSFPDPPNKTLYEHLSEFERMNQCYPYRPLHPELQLKMEKSRALLDQYNLSSEKDIAERRKILDELLHPSCQDKRNISIEPHFRCDYGVNITVGNNFQARFDCVLLDSGIIEIGDNCILSPGVHIYAATHPLNAGHRRLSDSRNYFELTKPVKIGNGCWLGGRCIVNPGVSDFNPRDTSRFRN